MKHMRDLLHSESYEKMKIGTLYRIQNAADAPSGWKYTIFVDVTDTWGNLLTTFNGRQIVSKFVTSDKDLVYFFITSGYRGFIQRIDKETWRFMELDESGVGAFRRARLAAQLAENDSRLKTLKDLDKE